MFCLTGSLGLCNRSESSAVAIRITSYNVCYTKLLRVRKGEEKRADVQGLRKFSSFGHRNKLIEWDQRDFDLFRLIQMLLVHMFDIQSQEGVSHIRVVV